MSYRYDKRERVLDERLDEALSSFSRTPEKVAARSGLASYLSRESISDELSGIRKLAHAPMEVEDLDETEAAEKMAEILDARAGRLDSFLELAQSESRKLAAEEAERLELQNHLTTLRS